MLRTRLPFLLLSLLPLGCGDSPANPQATPTKAVQFGEDRVPQPGDPAPVVVGEKFDGERSIKYLKQICDIGPRVSGSEGMKKQIELLTKHFEDLGGKVSKQEFQGQQKSKREAVAMTNLIVSWFPDRKNRVILCAHYDTRPFADQEGDRMKWGKPFVSANDGGSGIALMMELAHSMKDLPTEVGVDFVFFDAEEFVFTGPDGNDDYFIGSKYFANDYAKNNKKTGIKYLAAINYDMVGHENAGLRIEGFSWENARELVLEVWKVAEEQKAKSFKFTRGFNRSMHVSDDHISLQNAGIPAIDIIDFDYEHWHKLGDTPDKCTAGQMAQVGNVTLGWLKKKK
jgi:hypothetical protein